MLSKSVADGFEYYKVPGTSETTRFVRMFDKAFDCLNVRNLHEWREKRKADRKPYDSPTDERLEVHIKLMFSCMLFIRIDHFFPLTVAER